VLVGDFLLARALSIGARTGKLRVIEIMAHLTEEMSQGEIHQLANRGRLDVGEAEYREVIRRKTAELIEAACRVGAVIAGAPEIHEEALGRFGHHLGMAFQMVDDLLDYTADTGDVGKPVGTDLREGKLTLPLIHALAQAGPVERERMQALIGGPDISHTAFNALAARLEALGGLAYTRRAAAAHVEHALAALECFDPCRTRDLLVQTAEYTLVRRL
jgi:octaprenyl-diphosphate synthase